MSAGPLIASGIGVILLVATAYVLVGGTLATTEVMVEAQNSLVVQQEIRMRTAITIQDATIEGQTLYVDLKNTGSEPIVDVAAIDVYIYRDGTPHYTGDWTVVDISPDDIHPGMLDPGETLTLAIRFEGNSPGYVQIVTGNGISSSAYVR